MLPIPPDLEENVHRAEMLGRQLYAFDKVSAIGTDVLRENVGQLQGKGLGGYLTLREGDESGAIKDSFLVTFFTAEEPPRAAYEIRIFVRPARQTEYQAFDPPKSVTAGFSRLVHARQAAIAALPEVTQPMNPVVLPAEIDGEESIPSGIASKPASRDRLKSGQLRERDGIRLA